MTALIAFFLMAVAADFWAVKWHAARERRQLARVGALSAVLELLGWVPLWFAITQENVTWAAAAVLGSVVGSVWGCYREPQSSLPRAVGHESQGSASSPRETTRPDRERGNPPTTARRDSGNTRT